MIMMMRRDPAYLKMDFMEPIVADTIACMGKIYAKEIIKSS
jgi:hypothetical protein